MVLILTHRPGSAWEAKGAPAHRGPFLRGRAPSCSQHPLTPAPQSAWSPAADFASVTQALLRALTQLLYVPQSSSGNLGSTTLPADSTCSYCSAAAQMDKEPVCLWSSLGDGTQTNLRGLFLSVRPPPCLLGPRWWAVMSAVSGRCWFSHRHYFSNWKIEASLSRYFPGGGRDPGVLRDSSHLLQKSGVLRTPAKSSAPARPPPQPQAVITHHSRAPGLSCCRHGDGIPPSSRK